MKHSDFKKGHCFYQESGTWLCTDVGTRIATAIHVQSYDISNYSFPPYDVVEDVIDEDDMEVCCATIEEARAEFGDLLAFHYFEPIEIK